MANIIANHTIVDDYALIPQNYIDEVKKMFVSYAGESHAVGVRVGMNNLETLDSKYQVVTIESGTPPAYTTANLRFTGATWGDFVYTDRWRHQYGEEDWFTNATAIDRTKAGITYCNTNNLLLSALGFCWCYDDSHTGSISSTADPVYGCRWYGRSLEGPQGSRCWGLDSADQSITGNTVCVDTYLNATQEYVNFCIAQNYSTKIFFSTGPVEPTYYVGEAGYQASLKHQRIRDYVSARDNLILFDYADILCYDDGSEVMSTSTWNGYTFPFITTTNYGDGDIGHISAAGQLRIAKAMWWMLARIAGWDGLKTQLLIENQNLVYDGVPGWTGYNITRTTDTDLIFRNNYLSSDNISGYMLIAGDEVVGPYNNNLDGAIIEHNYFDWNGAPLTSIITHGVFGGYNIGFSVKYNYLDRVPMGIIRKSNGMTDTGGIVAYNIIKDPKPGVVCKGMNGVQIHNNTFYSSLNTTT